MNGYEIPQLINVLKGEMSLVGPRPLPERDSEILNELAPESFHRRLSVRPGLTGPWQVSGRSDLGFESMLKLDLDYVSRWSLAKDLRILAMTVLVVLTRKGAC
jgi:lipopolysaccharide/colanic/teichoic acid biosynthesis glycosyltransferase